MNKEESTFDVITYFMWRIAILIAVFSIICFSVSRLWALGTHCEIADCWIVTMFASGAIIMMLLWGLWFVTVSTIAYQKNWYKELYCLFACAVLLMPLFSGSYAYSSFVFLAVYVVFASCYLLSTQ